MTHLQT